jgi:mycothiol system anti-sigma-R factor
MEKRELALREAVKCHPDPSTGLRQGNLAFIYRAQERAAGALPLEQRVRQYFAGPCDEVLNRMYGYLDGELDDIDCAKIRQHLDECGPCLREYGLQEAVRRIVEKHTGGDAPPELRAKILVRIREVRASIEFGD